MGFSDRSLHSQSHSRHWGASVMRFLVVLFQARRIRLPRLSYLLMIPATLIASSSLSHAGETVGNSSAATDEETNEVLVDRWHGFWLGQSIANWTGLVTEMDKIGGDGPHGEFYRRSDWGGPDQPAIWDGDMPSAISSTIDFVLRRPGELWGADDDTDIEYIYLWTLHESGQTKLTPEAIREAWLTHIYDEQAPTPYGADGDHYQNFLWVSNQRAHELMLAGQLPPATGQPEQNPHGEMIDAQLTTEIFGLLAPGSIEEALALAYYPIRTAGRGDAALVSEFYVAMHSLVAAMPRGQLSADDVIAVANEAREVLPEGSTPRAMFDFVLGQYLVGEPWESARDAVYQRYQVEQADGYDMSSRDLYCNGCFAAGINFASSLVSLFYGEGDFRETTKIAVLCGWDSDNPAATWGGLFGFSMGAEAIEQVFGEPLSDGFHIHRTRRGFPNEGIDSFPAMAKMGIEVTRRIRASKEVSSD
jgi:hypothetical protein